MIPIKEIFLSIQGEGYYTGRPAVFCRFSGCNLWSGREVDRDKAQCVFCDTDFIGIDGQSGNKYKTAKLLVREILSYWPSKVYPFVVLTGGEPMLQVDKNLINEFTDNFEDFLCNFESLMRLLSSNITFEIQLSKLFEPDNIHYLEDAPQIFTKNSSTISTYDEKKEHVKKLLNYIQEN